MRGRANHQRRWASDSVPDKATVSSASSPAGSTESNSAEEFVEVTIDFQDDDTIVLRSVEPAIRAINIEDGPGDVETPSSASRSPSMKRSSSSKLRQISQELKAEAVSKARQFSQELRAELRRFSWSHGHASRVLSASTSSAAANGGVSNGLDSALAARALRKQRAQLDRTRSGAAKALRGLKFISTRRTNDVDAWNEVQSNFDKLAKDGYLHRADFAQCIGSF